MWQIIEIYICANIMMIGVLSFEKIVLDESIKISKIQLVILFQIVSIAHTIAGIYCFGILKTLIMFFINFFFYKYTFKISIHRAIFLTFLYMILLIIVDLLELFVLTKLFNVNKNFYYTKFAGSILENCTICLFVIGLSLLFQRALRKLMTEKVENSTKIIIFFVLTSMCILMFFYTIVKEFRFSNDVILYLIAIVVLISVLFSLIKQTIENNKLTEKYDKLLEFMITYENEIEKQRILRHEVKNEFRTIRAKICDKQKNQEIIEYIDEIVNDKYEVKQ